MEISKHSERPKSTVQSNDEALMYLDAQPGRTAFADGKEYLFFSGYAYLGMHQHAGFLSLVKEGIERYGWSFPSSRVSNTRLKLFERFEEKLSKLTDFEHTTSVSNGYTAGRMAMQLFAHKANFLIGPNAHPAVSDGYPKFQGSQENWVNFVLNTLNEKNQFNTTVIVSDSVNPLKGEVIDLSFLQFIQKKCVCIIDDSHGIGLIGKNGRGVIDSLPENPNIEYILVYSLSKAFNLNGGAISTNNCGFADKLRNLPAYSGATGMNPALMHAFLHADAMYAEQLQSLRRNIKTFSSLVKSSPKIRHSHLELPFFVCENADEDLLRNRNILISSFAYPDPAGSKVQRIVINALHTNEDLQQLADALD